MPASNEPYQRFVMYLPSSSCINLALSSAVVLYVILPGNLTTPDEEWYFKSKKSISSIKELFGSKAIV